MRRSWSWLLFAIAVPAVLFASVGSAFVPLANKLYRVQRLLVPAARSFHGLKWNGERHAAKKKTPNESKPATSNIERGQSYPKQIKRAWEETFELLKQYKEKHGDCLVPYNYTVNGSKLGMWATRQRHQQKTGSLSSEKYNKLEDLGFVWDAHELAWNENYILLKDYQEEHGNCLVPEGYTVNGSKLVGG
jgi:hypothetical protein